MDRVTEAEIAELEESFAALSGIVAPVAVGICRVGLAGGALAVLLMVGQLVVQVWP